MANVAKETRRQAVEDSGVRRPVRELNAKELAAFKSKAEAKIDAFMQKVGYKNPAERTDEYGWRWFELGSASGRAGVVEIDGMLFLRVEADIMPIPADKDLLLPLMRELLEMDARLAGEARIGIENNHVHTAAMMPIHLLLDDEGFARCIHACMSLADNLDDQLVKKYGGTSLQRSKV